MQTSLMQRLMALLALILYATLVVLLVRATLSNLGFATLLTLTAIFLTYAILLIFSGDKMIRKGYWFLGFAVVALSVELVYFFLKVSSFVSTSLFIAFALVYTVVTRYLSDRYWKARRTAAESTQKIAHFKRPFLIINPKSGNGRAIKAKIDTLAREQGIEVLMLQRGDDVAEVAERAVIGGADVLGISGGDGSIGAVAQVALKHSLPVVVLPGGTKCHFARDIGLDPKHIVDALSAFHGIERRVDMGDINGRIFLNNASFGLYADIIDHPGYRNHKLRTAQEVLKSFANGSKKLYDLQYKRGSESIRRSLEVLVGVNRYNTLDVWELGKREKLDEGVLQVTAVKKLDETLASELVHSAAHGMSATSFGSSDIEQWTAKRFSVDSRKNSLVVGVDGERETYATPVIVRILPKSLRVFVPAEGVRGRPINTFSFAFVRQIWHTVGGHVST